MNAARGSTSSRGWTANERRLTESAQAAAHYAETLCDAGIPQRVAFQPTAFDAFALVLVEVHGEPWGLVA